MLKTDTPKRNILVGYNHDDKQWAYSRAQLDLDASLRRIRELLRDDPGDDEAPVTDSTVNLAESFVQSVGEEALAQRLCWRAPIVSADDAGHIHLEWRSDALRVLLIVNGDQPDQIVCVVKVGSSSSVRTIVDRQTALLDVIRSFQAVDNE